MKKKKHLQERSKRSERRGENSREIVKRKGVDVLWGNLVEGSA
jgi:hypothetical protein